MVLYTGRFVTKQSNKTHFIMMGKSKELSQDVAQYQNGIDNGCISKHLNIPISTAERWSEEHSKSQGPPGKRSRKAAGRSVTEKTIGNALH